MNNLYITGTDTYLKVQDQHLLVFHPHKPCCKVAINQVKNLVLIGYCKRSDKAIHFALSRCIPVLFLDDKGNYFGRIETEERRRVKYLAHQLKRAKDIEFTKGIAESIVRAKLHNSCALLRHFSHCHPTKATQKALDTIALLIDNLPLADSVDLLRGYGQTATKLYFQSVGSLFAGAINFDQPIQHQPTHPINSLLNLGYTLLNQNIYALLQAVGLHSHFGNLHIHRDHHPALVADFMEEFSALLVDALVVDLVILQLFTPADFTLPDARGGVYLYPNAINKFIKYWEKTLQGEVNHLYAGTVNYQQCLEWQVQEYLSCLLGEREFYRPFLSKK